MDSEMYGYICGFAETDNVKYCPYCGEKVAEFYADGKVLCDKCGLYFAVVECDEVEDEFEDEES